MRLSKTHQGQHFAQGAKRQARYRGYDIFLRRRDLCWMVTIRPSHPELPVFRRHPFQTATQSEREALAQAKRRVDDALVTSKLTYSGQLSFVPYCTMDLHRISAGSSGRQCLATPKSVENAPGSA